MTNSEPHDRKRADISVVIPTLNRPEPLTRAVSSVLRQRFNRPRSIEIVVVDNSPDGNAGRTVAGLQEAAQAASFALIYLSMPEPGVANARNAGVAQSVGALIAFLDDDEEADDQWLDRHAEIAESTGADAVFGPVRAAPEPGSPSDASVLLDYFERRMELEDGSDITDKSAYLGTNNSLFRRETCLTEANPFDVRLNRSGGEDSLLLRRLRMAGRRFAWSAAGGVTEHVPPRRLTWAYVLKRKRLSGQVRSFVCAMVDPPRRMEIAFWMAAGGVQALLGYSAWALLKPIDRHRALRSRAVAAGGVGKLLWMRRFRPGLYGTGLVS